MVEKMVKRQSNSLYQYIHNQVRINSISHYHETLGEALQGTELEFSGLQIDFKADIHKTEYCKVGLNDNNLKAFLYAVKNHYWYQMYLDDLPIWGIVGEIDDKAENFFIWTHKKFEIGYNVLDSTIKRGI